MNAKRWSARKGLGEDSYSLGQIQQQGINELTYDEASTISLALNELNVKIQGDPVAPCVTRLDRRRLDDIQSRLSNVLSYRKGPKYLTSDDIAILDEAILCSNELSQRLSSEGTFPVGLAITGLLAAASVGVSAYHGYKRNDSVGWGAWWGFMGLILPVITPAVAIAQGYGDRAK